MKPIFQKNLQFGDIWRWNRQKIAQIEVFGHFLDFALLVFFALLLYIMIMSSCFLTIRRFSQCILVLFANLCDLIKIHHAHLSSCAKSRKTNNVNSRKWLKTSIWAIFWQFKGQISPNRNFFWKLAFIQIEVHI